MDDDLADVAFRGEGGRDAKTSRDVVIQEIADAFVIIIRVVVGKEFIARLNDVTA